MRPLVLAALAMLVNLFFVVSGCGDAGETKPNPDAGKDAGHQGGGGNGGAGGQINDGGDCDGSPCPEPCDGGIIGADGGCVPMCDGSPCPEPCDGGVIGADGGCVPMCDGSPCPELCDGGVIGADGGCILADGGDGGVVIITCSVLCHGSAANAAPPAGLGGEVDTTDPPVGAHQQHLATSSWHKDVACSECHIVPTKPKKDPTVPTHMNGVDDIIWGPIAQQGTFDFALQTCTSVYCHGGTLKADATGQSTNRVPLWTKVDGTQAVCGEACHTTPPGGGHATSTACATCHGMVIASFTPAAGGNPASATWVDKDLHVNGAVEVTGGALNCRSCHGDTASGNPAPPRGTNGEMLTTDPAVGAHASHLSTTTWHRDVVCTDCHTVPTSTSHSNGVVDFTWGAVPTAHGASPAFDGTANTCQNVYCHGTTLLSGGTLTTPSWTTVDGTQKACGTCHGLPPDAPHPQGKTDCSTCHPAVIASCPPNDPAHCVFQPDSSATQSYKLHINGVVEVVGGACDSCHGAPPNNGAHQIHAGGADVPTAYGSLAPRTNAASYSFNCGYCHPLDASKHMNGTLEVELYDPAAPAVPADPLAAGDRRTVKRENPQAAYVPGTQTFQGEQHSYSNGSCSKVYCHSAENPQAVNIPYPTSAAAPATFSWVSVTPFYDVTQNQCCNGTADDYPDFTVNVTRKYASPKWVGETYAGAARCGHCHAYPPRAAPPGNEGAGQGHAWMDSGFEDGHFYNMAAGWPIQCRRCHQQTVAGYLADSDWHYQQSDWTIVFDQPMAIADFTTHVNGKKDVAFDLSPANCDQTSPDLQYSGLVTVPCLKTATFDPATRRCSNVECHLAQTTVTWGAPYRADWGSVECNACHQY
jgi:predicted CxxxxCH...CXXCH cytochrome family protein